MLKKEPSNNHTTFRSCCEQTIKIMNKNGVTLINNHQTLMKWNRMYHLDEVFPHPNINIQMGNTYHSEFLESFPEVKIMIKKWANANLEKLDCENVGIFIRTDVIPKIYNTYLSEENDSGDKPLSLEEFLKIFRLKM